MTAKTAEELRRRVEYIMADFHIPVHERERIKLVVSDYAEALARERALVVLSEIEPLLGGHAEGHDTRLRASCPSCCVAEIRAGLEEKSC